MRILNFITKPSIHIPLVFGIIFGSIFYSCYKNKDVKKPQYICPSGMNIFKDNEGNKFCAIAPVEVAK